MDPVERITADQPPPAGQPSDASGDLVDGIKHPSSTGDHRVQTGRRIVVRLPARRSHPLDVARRPHHLIFGHRVSVRAMSPVRPLIDLLRPRLAEGFGSQVSGVSTNGTAGLFPEHGGHALGKTAIGDDLIVVRGVQRADGAHGADVAQMIDAIATYADRVEQRLIGTDEY